MAGKKIKKLDKEGVAAWNTHDMERFAALCADDIVWRDTDLPEPVRGKEGIRQIWEGWHTSFPDLNLDVTNRVASGNSIAVEFVFSGTHSGPIQMGPDVPPIPATGKKVALNATYFSRFSEGKLAEIHLYPNTAAMMTQLGLMPGSEA